MNNDLFVKNEKRGASSLRCAKRGRERDYIMANSTANTTSLNCIYNTPMVMQDTSCRLSFVNVINEVPKLEVQVFPNPFRNEITLRASELISSYQITDIQGRVIQQETISPTTEYTVRSLTLSAGIYWVKIQSKNKTSIKQMICE